LSSINSGKRRLGAGLAARLAAELGVNLVELGAPAAAATNHASLPLLRRLEELEARVEKVEQQRERALRAVTRRLAELEAVLETQGQTEARRSKGGQP
jgi:hypothetical protein